MAICPYEYYRCNSRKGAALYAMGEAPPRRSGANASACPLSLSPAGSDRFRISPCIFNSNRVYPDIF
ncbi:hypothetical protein [Scytonema sp. PRP1]|uniref:hypothetical protein n=1 Tax=Scytonema sp. PRP1 TaxID=3120513 RepID=UPI002FD76455